MNNPQVSPQVGIAQVNRNLSEWADKSVFIVMLPDSDDQNGDHVVCDSYGHQFRRTKLIGEDKMPDDIRLFTLSEALHEIACYAWEHRAAYISHAELGVSAIIARKQSAEENVRPVATDDVALRSIPAALSFIKHDARPVKMFVIGRWTPESGGEYLDDAEPTANAILTVGNAKHFGTESEASGHLENVVDEPEKWQIIERGHNFHARLKKKTEQANAKEPSAPAKSVMQPSEGA